MKKLIVGLLLSALLAVSGYAGKTYFDEHYVLLNEQEVEALVQNVAMAQAMAYAAGKQACNKTL